MFASPARRFAVVAVALTVVACASAPPTARDAAPPPTPSTAFVSDSAVRVPPASGEQAYGVFGPGEPGFPKAGSSYVDAVFGTTIRRITGEFPYPANNDIYSKNGFWNADG